MEMFQNKYIKHLEKLVFKLISYHANCDYFL